MNETKDPYEHLRKAYKEGKTIEMHAGNGYWWPFFEEPMFTCPPQYYRIKEDEDERPQ